MISRSRPSSAAKPKARNKSFRAMEDDCHSEGRTILVRPEESVSTASDCQSVGMVLLIGRRVPP
jgi:hypothetical protein